MPQWSTITGVEIIAPFSVEQFSNFLIIMYLSNKLGFRLWKFELNYKDGIGKNKENRLVKTGLYPPKTFSLSKGFPCTNKPKPLLADLVMPIPFYCGPQISAFRNINETFVPYRIEYINK